MFRALLLPTNCWCRSAMSISRFALLRVALALASVSASAQTTPLQSTLASGVTQANAVSSVLAPGDIVKLRIWREPDLSGEFPVDENGIVTFPKIGALDVLKESPESLKETLLAKYDAFLRNPSVEVTLLRRINVLGAVQ